MTPCEHWVSDWALIGKLYAAEFLHVKPGKGAAFVRSKLKNLKTGNTLEKTFRAGEPLEPAAVIKRQCQYTYSEVCYKRKIQTKARNQNWQAHTRTPWKAVSRTNGSTAKQSDTK
jgi:hypothetical protein